MVRALLLSLIVAPLLALDAAAQRAGGVQVAPVMFSLSAESAIAALRVRNGRGRAVAFEADVYEWRQQGGRDVLTPSRALLVAPGVFEIEAGETQVVRLGLVGADADARAFRIILRELPAARDGGAVLGFSLELSLPVFVAGRDGRGRLQAQAVDGAEGPRLRLANHGAAHMRLVAIEAETGALVAPRYLLAGAEVEIALPSQAQRLRLVSADIGGAEIERIVHVERAPQPAALR